MDGTLWLRRVQWRGSWLAWEAVASARHSGRHGLTGDSLSRFPTPRNGIYYAKGQLHRPQLYCAQVQAVRGRDIFFKHYVALAAARKRDADACSWCGLEGGFGSARAFVNRYHGEPVHGGTGQHEGRSGNESVAATKF